MKKKTSIGPCSRCLSDDISVITDDPDIEYRYIAKCSNCNHYMGFYRTTEEAVGAWNKQLIEHARSKLWELPIIRIDCSDHWDPDTKCKLLGWGVSGGDTKAIVVDRDGMVEYLDVEEFKFWPLNLSSMIEV